MEGSVTVVTTKFTQEHMMDSLLHKSSVPEVAHGFPTSCSILFAGIVLYDAVFPFIFPFFNYLIPVTVHSSVTLRPYASEENNTSLCFTYIPRTKNVNTVRHTHRTFPVP
jgi:hypothetical protein